MSANFRENVDWPGKLRGWESRGQGPEPNPGLWDRLEESLVDEQPDNRPAVWWWSGVVGGLFFLLAVGWLIFGATPNDRLAGIPETRPSETKQRMKVAGESPPAGAHASGAAMLTASARTSAVVSTDGKPFKAGVELSGNIFREGYGPDSPTTAVEESGGQSFNSVVANPHPPTPESDTEAPTATMRPLAVRPLPAPALTPLSTNWAVDQSALLTEATLSGELVSFSKPAPRLRYSVHGGPGLYHGQIQSVNGVEVPEALAKRRSQPTTLGGHLGLRLDYGRFGLSAGLRYNEQSATHNFSRIIQLDRQRETPEPGGILKSNYEVNLAAADGMDVETVEISRRAGQILTPNPRIRLDFLETRSLNVLSFPLRLHYRQPLGNGPFSLELNGGVMYNTVDYVFTYELESASFLGGQSLERFRLNRRQRSFTYNFWSASAGVGLRYDLPQSPFGFGISADVGRSLGDFRGVPEPDTYIGTEAYELVARYSFGQ